MTLFENCVVAAWLRPHEKVALVFGVILKLRFVDTAAGKCVVAAAGVKAQKVVPILVSKCADGMACDLAEV